MQTPLFNHHVALGAKMVNFAGWEMPIYYKQGINHEHLVVRNHVGLFDVSHMGRIVIIGPDTETFLDYLSTNAIAGKDDYLAIYNVFCNASGGCIDDVLVYRINSEHAFVVVNASNRQKDLNHLLDIKNKLNFNVSIFEKYSGEGILAIQGPHALRLIADLFPNSLLIKPMHFAFEECNGEEFILSRTGYTGAGGFEIYASSNKIIELWELFLNKGKAYGIEPIGLGARNTLRLEMGYALYGHEISDDIAPNESVSRWTIKWKKAVFLGKEALVALEQSPEKRSEYGIMVLGNGIIRDGYKVYEHEKNTEIGSVTSGSFSPSLEKGIGIVLVKNHLSVGDKVDVDVRGRRIICEVVQMPFYK